MSRLHPIDEGLWVADDPLRFLGIEVGARMAVVRLNDGGLLVHSPLEAAPALVDEVKALGPITHLVAPNKLHHLYVGAWKEAFPDAALHAAPGLETKRKDLAIDHVLTAEAPEAWRETLDQVLFEGFPFANEAVFFHRASGTLLVSDLVFHLGDESPLATRLFVRLTGTYGRLGPTLLEKIAIRDRPAFRACLERVLDWPFERVVVAHGTICEADDAKAQLARGYDWLLAG